MTGNPCPADKAVEDTCENSVRITDNITQKASTVATNRAKGEAAMNENRTLTSLYRTICRSACVMLLCVVSASCDGFKRRPADIEVLFRNFLIEYIELKPETGTAVGFPADWGIKVKNDALDDESDEGLDKIYDLYRKYRNWLAEYDGDKLSRSQRVAAEVLKWFLESELQGEEFRNHTYIIHPMFGFHASFVTLMTEHHRISNHADALDYINRLKCVATKVSQLIGRLEKQKMSGIIPPSYVVDTYLQMLNEFIQVPCEDNVIYTSFRDRIEKIEAFDNGTRRKLCNEVISALKASVYPSYVQLIECISIIRRSADRNAGVWKLPGGDEYYRYCLRAHTTTQLTPEMIYDLGIEEVKRIQTELLKQFRIMGISGSDNFTESMLKYQKVAGDTTNERYFFRLTEEGKVQTLLAYQAIIDTMQMRLPELFSTTPSAQVRVVRIPAYRERIIGTYYQPPKLDGSEGGIFYANLLHQHPKSGMKALTYHEAIPGHHLQIALEQEHTDARLFKTLFFFTGYVEGWALYAEKLALEQGYYDNTTSIIGYLRSELFRALRLVVDTGIHCKKWTREQASQYLLDNIGWSSYSEIDRYIMWPGQACAYKVGELKILQLRDRAQSALGKRFDIKEFHDIVLQHGSVPLAVLERLVDDYVESSVNPQRQ